MILHWPQVTYLILLVIGVAISAEKHGKPRTGNYSFPTSLVAAAIISAILYFGGFWTGVQP